MPNGLRQIPRTEFGSAFDGVQTADLGSALVLPAGNIAQASLGPGKLGKPAINKSGVTVPLGALVLINGYDTASGLPTVVPAVNNAAGGQAQYVAQVAVPNNATGQIGVALALGNQNTNAWNVGDPLFLSNVIGAYTHSVPTAPNTFIQLVGHVAIKHPSAGVVNLEIYEGRIPIVIGSNELQAGAVGAVALTANMTRVERSVAFSVPVTGAAVEFGIPMDKAGTIAGLQLNCNTALALNGTNYVTVACNNRTQTFLLTQAVVGNSTNTGGNAIAQYTAYPLILTATGANLVVAANDYVTALFTVTGTLGAVLTGTFSVVVAPN